MAGEDMQTGKKKPEQIVGIGASAGGLEALEELFRALPSDSGLAFVVIQHLSPDYKSLMVELLSKYTDMKVVRAENGMDIEADTVYLITPRKNLVLRDSKLYLTDQLQDRGLNLPIDIFLRSLADDQSEGSIAIILSGTGSDGTLGIRAVKGAGGLVFSQDNESAKFDGMPRSAAATGLVDFVLPPARIAAELMRFISHPVLVRGGETDGKPGNNSYIARILAVLRTHTGTDFSAYRENTVIRRVERRIGITQTESIEDYIALLAASPGEAAILYKDLLIGVTRFFRDEKAFKALADKVAGELLSRARKSGQLRIWVPGCSTGEEAYSIAIIFAEEMERRKFYPDIKILATDIDRDSIEYAGAGIYPESIITDIDAELLHKYFHKKDSSYQIRASIRKMVIFANHNVLKDPPFSAIDLASCRNMLIYFKPEIQKRVLNSLHFSLRNGGYLFLGGSESVGDLTQVFRSIDKKARIYLCEQGMKYPRLSEFYVAQERPAPAASGKYPERLYRETKSDTAMIDAAYDILFREFIPGSVIIDSSLELVHICREAEPFIRMPAGRASLNLLDLVPPGIKAAVGTAVHKAVNSKEPVVYGGLALPGELEERQVDLSVRPVTDARGEFLGHFLVVFRSRERAANECPPAEAGETIGGDQSGMILDLEQELQYTRENLQATIEELETSNEELQATNEELIASNEELQSTNEELQSVNEELYTVNSEYQKKNSELQRLNNDINNFLKNTDIGMVFLDKELTIRKFTPAIAHAVNIMEMDTGRPLQHITRNIEYDNFMEDIRQVLRTLIPKEAEVKTGEGYWMLMRILPYRTIHNSVDGIVVTFLDIHERKNFEIQLQRERNLLIRVLENSPVAKTMVDERGRIIYANTKAEKIFRMKREEIYRRSYDDPAWEILDTNRNPIPAGELPFSIIKNTGEPISGYRHYIGAPDGKGDPLFIEIHGSPIFDEAGGVNGAVFAIEEIQGE